MAAKHKKKSTESNSSVAAAPNKQLKIRMYRHGLGDCFLLRLPRDDGETYNILIDCGLISVAEKPKETMQGVVADIESVCSGKLDLVVATHEHWDHVSGFSSAQAQAEFNKLDIGEAWYAWTEDPKNKLGNKLRKERESKLAALNRAVSAMRQRNTPLSNLRGDRVESLLNFFGGPEPLLGASSGPGVAAAKVGRSRLAFEYPGKRPGVQVRYCYPNADPVVFPGVSGVRAYVLGPPEDESLIKRSAPTKKGKEVYEFGPDMAFADSLGAAFDRLASGASSSGDSGRDCPFEQMWARRPASETPSAEFKKLLAEAWDPAELQWRRIDDDWTAAAETLALNLDSHTNNTCLVLAFELIGTGKVLLFAADAQVGNWLSWQSTKWSLKDGNAMRDVVGPDLLRRCCFYKVGHHGSHNATLRTLGLEQMASNELVAFIPVFRAQAEKNRWHAMPFKPLVTRLREKTGGRLVFSDSEEPAPRKASLTGLTSSQGDDFVARLQVEDRYYEYSIDL
jgi:hypothetical protein